MERNFKSPKIFPFLPGRFWWKNMGLPSFTRTRIITVRKTGLIRISPTREKTISSSRFPYFP